MKIIKNIIIKIKLFIKKLFCVNLLDAQSIVNYIFSTESLPKPLTNQEEYDLLYKLENYKDQTSKSILIEHNLRLVMYIAKKFANNNLDMQDLVSVGAIGLIKAIDSYKIDKNIKLATYASRCIENEILMYLRKINKTINDLSLDSAVTNEEDGNNLTLGELIADEHQFTDDVELKDQKSYLIQAIDNLNDRDRKIMYMRYGLDGKDELTQKEVADIMNISQSYISRLEKKILHKLKKEITTNV